jgi:hypothetical protein
VTQELRQLLRERARSLQVRLNHGRVDPVTAATQASRLFTDTADAARTRWLDLELHEYGDLADSMPLHAVLGVPSNDRLAAHVAAYRTQRGIITGAGDHSGEFRHFFVESLPALVAASVSVASSGGTSSVELDFGPPSRLDYPQRGLFGRDVFERVIAGFVAALYLQLGTLVE